MGSFDGISIALSSLYAQRRALDVAGQNIANANTDGYSRQRVVMDSMGAPATPAMWSTWQGGGSGVAVSSIQRLRDGFLEMRGQTAHATQEELSMNAQATARVEGVFNEPSDNALQSILGEFWSGFDAVANRPNDLAARSQLLQRGQTLTDWMHQASGQLSAQWSSYRDQLTNIAAEVNSTAADVANLNAAVMRGTQANLPVNELADQRDKLVMKLAELVGATTKAGDSGTVDVYLGGASLIRGSTYNQIQVGGPTMMTEVSATNAVSLQWAKDSSAVQQAGGTGNAIVNALADGGVIPGFTKRLDAVAASVASAVNTQHKLGYDLAGNAGTDFFTASNANPVGAANIVLAFSDPAKVAASGVATVPPATGGNLDGGNADLMSKLGVGPTAPDAVYRQLVVDLGVQGQTATRRLDTQTQITQQLDNSRDAQAGVSLDEEMANMLLFQRAYEAAARVMTTVDSALDTLINRTGLVGR